MSAPDVHDGEAPPPPGLARDVADLAGVPLTVLLAGEPGRAGQRAQRP
jgi:hypothetical protein